MCKMVGLGREMLGVGGPCVKWLQNGSRDGRGKGTMCKMVAEWVERWKVDGGGGLCVKWLGWVERWKGY